MDDYIAKPFTLEQLAAILRQWLPAGAESSGRPAREPAAASTIPAQGEAPAEQPVASQIDDGLLNRLGSRLPPDRMARLVGTFSAESPKLLDRMTAAAASGDADELRLAAHSLKGSSAFLGAVGLSELARRIELDSNDPAHCVPMVREAAVIFYEAARQLRSRFPEAESSDQSART
jgi:HPt (histidine-containing phosphotransfer) domain-containing protein